MLINLFEGAIIVRAKCTRMSPSIGLDDRVLAHIDNRLSLIRTTVYRTNSRCHLKKKGAEIRANQMDSKRSNHPVSAAHGEGLHGDDNIVIGGRSKHGSDILLLGSTKPLRCLSASCISKKDLEGDVKSSYKSQRTKGRKKQYKKQNKVEGDNLRHRYIQRLKQVIAAGNSKQNQAETDRKMDLKPQRYQLRTTELIWLELQSWLNDRSLADQDQILYNARQFIVKDVVSLISNFCFEGNNLEHISSLRDQINYVLDRKPDMAYDCDLSLPTDAKVEIVDERKDFKDLSEDLCASYLRVPSSLYHSLQRHAIRQIGELLRMLCIIENLYPTSAMLAREFSCYSGIQFQFKVNALCCWYNITLDLQRSFSSLVQILSQCLPTSGSRLLTGASAKHACLKGPENSGVYIRDISELLASYVVRALKQKSVKSILQSLIARHFTALLRAKMALMPISCYESDILLESENSGERGSVSYNTHATQIEAGEHPPASGQYIRMNRIAREVQEQLLSTLLEKIGKVLSLFDIRISKDRCVAIVGIDTPALCTEQDSVLFGLPAMKPLYMFFSGIFVEIMQHCMHQRMKQAMPFFENCCSSVCLLTAKQLVMESKEMLECAFLARDLTQFFIGDVSGCDVNPPVNQACEEDLHGMITTYLDFVNTWLLRIQRDLPHVPRGFQETLEQEWLFACNMSPHLDLEVVILCYSRFIKISADIMGSTEEFLVTATSELFNSEPNLIESVCHDQMEEIPPPSDSNNKECSSKAQAGVLWFHRQRSESPHLSRNSSTHSTGSIATANSTVELTDQMCGVSLSSSLSDSWSNFQHSRDVGFQKRYLFEVCRAVRDLFNETRERSTRILSFAKQLRKKLEPGIAYDIIKQDSSSNSTFSPCVYCTLMRVLHSNGYVVIDFEDTAMNVNCGLGIEDHLMLENFWIMVPVPSLLKEASRTSFDAEARESQSGHLWSVVRRSLLNHMKKLPQSTKEENCQLRSVVFVKKPLSHQLEHNVAAERLRKNTPKNISDGVSSQQQFSRPENNVRFHSVDSDRFEECFGYNCPSKLVLGKHCANSLTLICQNFDFTRDITVVVPSAEDVGIVRKEFTILLSSFAKLAVAQMPVVREIQSSFHALRVKVLQLCEAVMNCIESSLNYLEAQNEKILQQHASKSGSYDADLKWQLKSEVNEVMQSCFNFAFDFVKEATRIMSGDFRSRASEKHVKLVMQWMDHALRRRERGNGKRPRWASQGLMFLCSLDTNFWMEMSDEKFENLKHKIDTFIQHLIGDTQPNAGAKSVAAVMKEPRSFGSLEIPADDVQILRSLSNSSNGDSTAPVSPIFGGENIASQNIHNGTEETLAPAERVRIEIEEMEELIDRKRIEAGIIGRVSDTQKKNPIINLGVRTVNFKWQRGARVGEGAFGRVYTCVNIDSGRILAMKEVKFHPNDHQKIRSAVDEYTNFEGIKHQNLVQYYGVELHRDEMYIFMEYCDGGTLGDICKINLPEPMVRKYTVQLLSAVHALHAHGIVHRDIKGSNVFLDSTGMIKLGDFGSAIKLKDVSKTTPGEMVSQIGTTLPYSAPEVINSSEKIGYGRGSDIWSLGCVVIEMASGKQPWHGLERFQVMFRIGSGERPPVPESFSEEGTNFVQLCTVTDPFKRWTAEQLLGHSFVKVLDYDELF